MKQVEVMFKRRGVTALVEIHHDEFYLEFFHLIGCLSITKYKKEVVEIKNREGEVVSSYLRKNEFKAYRGKINFSEFTPFGAIPMIEEILKDIELEYIKINPNHVEAYCIGDNKRLGGVYPIVKNDISTYKNVCVDGLTVKEVRDKVDLKLKEDFRNLKIEKIWETVGENLGKVDNMLFTDFYIFLQGNNYKVDFKERCKTLFI